MSMLYRIFLKLAIFLLLVLSLLVPLTFAATISGTVYDMSFERVTQVIVEINTVPKQTFVAVDGHYSFQVPEGTYTLFVTKNSEIANETVTVQTEGDFVIDLLLFPTFDEEDAMLDDVNEENDLNISDDLDILSYKKDITGYVIALFLVVLVNVLFLFRKRLKAFYSYVRLVLRHETETQALEYQKKKVKESIEESINKSNNKPNDKKIEVLSEGFISKNSTSHIKSDVESDSSSVSKSEIDSYRDDEHVKAIIDCIKKEDGRTTQKIIRKEVPLSEAKISLVLTELEHRGVIKKYKTGRSNVVVLVNNR